MQRRSVCVDATQKCTGLNEWQAAFLSMSSQIRLVSVERKQGHMFKVIRLLCIFHFIRPYLPSRHPHCCLFTAITIIPVIWVKQDFETCNFPEACPVGGVTRKGFLSGHYFDEANSTPRNSAVILVQFAECGKARLSTQDWILVWCVIDTLY